MSEKEIKFFVVGSRNAGKRSFIETISETIISPHVARDSGRVTIDECVVYLVGYYDLYLLSVSSNLNGFMKGFCLLIDSTDEKSFYEALSILKYLTLLDVVPYIVVANKQDLEGALTVGQIRRAMELPEDTIILPCVATERASVVNVLNTLLAMIRLDLTEKIT